MNSDDWHTSSNVFQLKSEADGETDRNAQTQVIDRRYDKLMHATIMMVDDEPTTLEIIQAFLQDEGYSNFVVTSDSTRAMELVGVNRPDLVLLDLNMPEVTGFDILKAMRAEQEFMHIPVIVLTSSTEAETKLKALELGASDFLSKPVDSSELALRLRNTLAAKAYQDHLTHYDALTGLPNRRRFLERLNMALIDAHTEGKTVTVLHLGIDHFKKINDSLGLAAGDAVLTEIANRLEGNMTNGGTNTARGRGSEWKHLSRISGDEFAVLLPDVLRIDDGSTVARRLLALVSKPLILDGHEVFVTGSIGIAIYPNDGEDPESMLKHASIATQSAKRHGGNTYQYYSDQINARSVERLRLENDLRKALAKDELQLHYQPILHTATGKLKGVEATMRWNHPELGLVMPDRFIPLAEESGIIVPIGDWVFHEASGQHKIWQEEGLGSIPVSVNVSSQQFLLGTLTRTLRDTLALGGMDPRHLTVELTETMLMDNAQDNVAALHLIKDMGVKVAIDDFGTGYSSLSYLKRFPLDELKIDRSFLGDVDSTSESDDAAIITAIIAMAHSLGLRVVAEGVENRRQRAFLHGKGCDYCQGFLFAPPMPAEDFSALLKKHKRPSSE